MQKYWVTRSITGINYVIIIGLHAAMIIINVALTGRSTQEEEENNKSDLIMIIIM